MNIHQEDLEVCVDCTQLIANGEDHTEEQDLEKKIEKQWGELAGHLVMSCDEGCEGEFSWRPCDGCGSTLGGDRHKATVLCEHEGCSTKVRAADGFLYTRGG